MINFSNPQTKLDKLVWWGFFLTVGWSIYLFFVVLLAGAYFLDRHMIMKSLRD